MSALLLSIFLITGSQNADVAQEIRELTAKFNQAYTQNELDEYFANYADDMTMFLSTGRMTLDQYKTDWYALVKGGGGVESNEISDLKVQVGPDGKSAIATYNVTVVTRAPDGKLTKEQAWESDIWFKLDGQWKITHLNYNSRPVP